MNRGFEEGSSQSQPSGSPERSPEPRSFLPVEVKPIRTSKPSNADLARGFNQLHLCHEDTKAKVVEIQHALGLTEGQKKVAGLSTPFKAYIRSTAAAASAFGGLVLLYRAAVALWPGTWAFIQMANHVILSGRF